MNKEKLHIILSLIKWHTKKRNWHQRRRTLVSMVYSLAPSCFSYMPHLYGSRVYIGKKYKYMWTLIPKAGSTSLIKIISTIEGLKDIRDLKDFQKFMLYSKKKTSSIKHLGDKYESHYKFCFVRNPWSRLLSLHKNKLSNLDFDFCDRFCKMNGVKKESLIKFEDFVRIVGKIPNCFCNSHLIPCSNIVVPQEMDYIGKIENFEADMRHVLSTIAPEWKNMEIPHKNITSNVDYRKYYTDELIDIVARKYAKDIELFNYQF